MTRGPTGAVLRLAILAAALASAGPASAVPPSDVPATAPPALPLQPVPSQTAPSQAPASAPDASLRDNPYQRLDDCVTAQAERLEISGEAADVVAAAALAKCNRELTAASQGGLLRSGADRLLLKDSMRESALVQVVELRAARHTPPPAAPNAAPRKKKKQAP